MTESEYADKLNQLQVENRNLRRTIGRLAIENGELRDAAEIRRLLDQSAAYGQEEFDHAYRRGFIDGQIDMRDRDIDSVQAKGG
jgi:hypothetical protein